MNTVPCQALHHMSFVTDTHSQFTLWLQTKECQGLGGAFLSLDVVLRETISARPSVNEKDQGPASMLSSDPSRGAVSCPQPLFASSLGGAVAMKPTSVSGGFPSSWG